MLRSLKEARYSTENAGHFGLACDCYTHFTSPIRRYPDLMVHRILRTLIRKGPEAVISAYGAALEKIAEQCSLRERAAMEAERESLETKQIMFMSTKVGEVFDGRITGVHSYGFFVQLVDTLAEGLVHVSSLDDDYYAFLEDKHSLLGENTRKVYRLGDEVQVQVVRVDVEKGRMDFIVVSEEAERRPAKPEAKIKKAKVPRLAAAVAPRPHPGRTSPGRRPRTGRKGRGRKR
jgi:ribonuclease R